MFYIITGMKDLTRFTGRHRGKLLERFAKFGVDFDGSQIPVNLGTFIYTGLL